MKIIGTTTTYHGTEHSYLNGLKVRILGLLKHGDPDDPSLHLRDQRQIDYAKAKVCAEDRLEVQPWLEEEGRYSFVTSDPLAVDLECFAYLR